MGLWGYGVMGLWGLGFGVKGLRSAGFQGLGLVGSSGQGKGFIFFDAGFQVYYADKICSLLA